MGIRKKAVLLVLALFVIFSVSSLSSLEYLDKDALPGTDMTRAIMMGYLTPVEPGHPHNYDYVVDDIVYFDMAGGFPIATNKQELIETMYFVYNIMFEDVAMEDFQLTVGNGRAVLEWVIVGRFVTEFAGIPATGEIVRVPMIGVYELQSEWPYKIRYARIYMLTDALSSEEQLEKEALPGIETTRAVVEKFFNPVNPGEHFNLDYVTDDVVVMNMTLGVPVATSREAFRGLIYYTFNINFEETSVEDVRLIIGNGIAYGEWTLVGVYTEHIPTLPQPSGEVERLRWYSMCELEEEWPYRIQFVRMWMHME